MLFLQKHARTREIATFRARRAIYLFIQDWKSDRTNRVASARRALYPDARYGQTSRD
jgi:hypothetical protein